MAETSRGVAGDHFQGASEEGIGHFRTEAIIRQQNHFFGECQIFHDDPSSIYAEFRTNGCIFAEKSFLNRRTVHPETRIVQKRTFFVKSSGVPDNRGWHGLCNEIDKIRFLEGLYGETE